MENLQRRFKYEKYISVLFLAFALSSEGFAAEVYKATGLVDRVDIFTSNWKVYDETDKGLFAIYISEIESVKPVGKCGSGINRILISTDHPLYHTVSSAVFQAQAMEKPVSILSCKLRSNSFDFAALEMVNQ